jgi:hypothetical protein
MQKMKPLFLSLLLALCLTAAQAQPFTVHGTVRDSAGKPLTGVNVSTRNASTATDSVGAFRITVCDLRMSGGLRFILKGYQLYTYAPKSSADSVLAVAMQNNIAPPPPLPQKQHSARPLVKGRGEAKDKTSTSIATTDGVADDELAVDIADLESHKVVVASEPAFFRAETSSSHKVVPFAESALEESVVVGYGGGAQKPIKSGTLTAGEVNDFAKWNLWPDVLSGVLAEHLNTWKFRPLQRYTAQLTNPQGMPIANAKVALRNASGHTLWSARTDNTGKAELWAGFVATDSASPEIGTSIDFEYKGATTTLAQITAFEQGINTAVIDAPCATRNEVDIFFMVDATGSMSDEISYLQAELSDIVRTVKQHQPELQLRVGGLVYRDYCEEYVTRTSPLDPDVERTVSFLNQQRAAAGGDYPEAVDEALYEAISREAWNDDALARIAFLVLDAPSHTFPETLARLSAQIRLAAEKGIRVVPIACSDIKKDGEYLMRCLALATNGTYIFLTDDSGVGNAHIKPSTDKYEVELLNAAIVRVIRQYTQLPDCANSQWPAELIKPDAADNFVPNPYDERPEANTAPLLASDLLKAYPNPCDDVLQVEIKRGGVQDIFLLDVTGKAVHHHRGNLTVGTTEINVSRFSAGIYFVKAFYGGRWYAVKVVVK